MHEAPQQTAGGTNSDRGNTVANLGTYRIRGAAGLRPLRSPLLRAALITLRKRKLPPAELPERLI